MIKLAIITLPTVISIDYYRTLGFYPFFGNLECEHVKEVNWHTLGKFDAVLVSRPFTMEHLKNCQIAKYLGKHLIVDFDDDMLNLPDVKTFRGFRTKEVQDQICESIAMADMLVVSNEYLRDLYSKYNPNIVVRPNMHNDRLFEFKPEFSRNNKVGFRGRKVTHEWNVKEFLKVFAMADDDWIFWGADMWLLPGKHIPEKPFIDYMFSIRKNAPGVVIKPLVDIPHNRGKSNCTWIEATYGGGVCLAPDWDEWHRPGIVNYTDVDDMCDKLEKLRKDEDWRRDCFKKSRDYIKENLLVGNVVFRPEEYGL